MVKETKKDYDSYDELVDRLLKKSDEIDDKELKDLLIEAAASIELLYDSFG